MKVKVIALSTILSMLSTPCFAMLETMENSELQNVSGQGGADLEMDLRINQSTIGPVDATPAAASNAAKNAVSICNPSTPQTCRMGFSVRHETSPGVLDASKSFWFALKGVSGGIYIPKLGIDGSDVKYVSKGGTEAWQSALKLTFATPTDAASRKINFNNFGYQALAIESYNGTGSDGTGYRNDTPYSVATLPVYDTGKETGIIGLNVHGAVSVQGSLKIFSCASDHPRC